MPGKDRKIRACQDIDQSLLDSFLDNLRGKFRLTSVVVFGSRATGENLEESDYDIFVISPDFAGYRPFERVELLLDAWPGLVPLEPVAMTPEEFNAADGALVWDILLEGLVLMDDGTFEEKRRRHRERMRSGELRKENDCWIRVE